MNRPSELLNTSSEITYQVGGLLPCSLVNGPGMRTVIFLSGCKHNCPGCHNKELQDYKSGKTMTLTELLYEINRSLNFGARVTISGGEPFDQDISHLLKDLHEQGVNDIWVYTGYTIQDLLNSDKPYVRESLKYINVVVDGKFIQELSEPTSKYAGSSNQRYNILENGLLVKSLENYCES